MGFSYEALGKPIVGIVNTYSEFNNCHRGFRELVEAVKRGVWQRGLRIPDHISIVGFDDTLLAQQVFPALTTVSQPIDEMARVAVSKLVDLVEGRNLEPVNVQIPTRLVIRSSCSECVSAARR
jgi:DNA-binding LacI/PurR family transcriptional regulator